MIAAYIAARGSRGHAQLVHRISDSLDWTACGLPVKRWSVQWLTDPIEILYCKNCAKSDGLPALATSTRRST